MGRIFVGMKLIYIVYPILLVVLFWGAKFFKPREFNEEAFSLRQMKVIQGFVALLIMFHHLGQKTSASWIDKKYYIGGLDMFVEIGFVLVTFFTFCSGYGLYKSFKSKPDYLNKRFILKRIFPVVALGYIVAWLYLPCRYLLGEKFDWKQFFYYLTEIKLCNPNGWYVFIIAIFYLCFFLAFKFIRNEKIALLAVFIFTVAYQLFCTTINHNEWWITGEWWFNSIHLFVVGIFFAMFEDKIVPHIKKYYIVYLIIAIALVLGGHKFWQYARSAFSYYGENWKAPDTVFRRRITLAGDIWFSSAVTFLSFLLSMKIRVGNRFLDFMGKITLEFYLIHGLFVELFCFAFVGQLRSLYYIKNQPLFVAVVFVLGIAGAYLLSMLTKKLKSIGGKERQPKEAVKDLSEGA